MRDIIIVFKKEVKDLFKAKESRRSWLLQGAIFIGIFGIYLPAQEKEMWLNTPIPALFFLTLPLLVACTVAADSFAGERERKTLETLLATRLSDRAIFLGKVLAALAYSWTFTLAAELTSLITVNVVKEAPGLFVYPPPMLFLGLVGSALTAIFAVGVGLFVSLKAKSVRAAQQMIGVVFFAIFFFGPMILARLITRPVGLKLTWGLVAPAAAVLALLDTLLLALAVKRFQRARLILD